MPGKPRAESRFVFGWETDGNGWSQTCRQESWSGEEEGGRREMEGLKAKRAIGTENGKGIGKGDVRKEKNTKNRKKTQKLPTQTNGILVPA